MLQKTEIQIKKYVRINEIVAFVWAVRYLLFNYQTPMNESMMQFTSAGYSTTQTNTHTAIVRPKPNKRLLPFHTA